MSTIKIATAEERRMNETMVKNAFPFGNVRAAYLPVTSLFVDGDYQRKPQSKINKIAANWDEDLCSFILVNYRQEIGKFAIIDGQNRFSAACIAGVEFLPCHILVNETKEEEAKRFACQDVNKTRVSPFDKFKAELLYGDKVSLKLKEICDSYGIVIKPACSKQTKHLKSITNTKEILRQGGEDGLRWIFDVIKASGWHSSRNAYCSSIVRGLYGVYTALTPAERDRAMAVLTHELSLTCPDRVIAKASMFVTDDRKFSALTRYLMNILK